jgi:hypothetical protein
MTEWRVSGALLVALAAATAGRGQTCTLAEAIKPGDCFRYGIDMSLSGEMRFGKDGRTAKVALSAKARHDFAERVLAAGGAAVTRTARVYEKATVTIERGRDKATTTLRPERKLMVAQRPKDELLVYSPAGALTRGELELVGGHFDTLSAGGLLPGKAVKVGDTWKPDGAAVQALCALEGLTESKLTAKLEGVKGDEATFSVSGTATGVDAGAMVKLTVEASGTFDAKAGRLTKVVWKQKCERDMGPVSPASTLTVTVTLTRQAIAQPKELSDVALVSVPSGDTPPGPMTNLEHRDARGRFALVHTRDWHLTGVTEDHTVLRLMDRGDYVAQVTVTPWAKAKKGEHLTGEQFKAAMDKTTGWRPDKEVQSGVVPSEGGRRVYRYSVTGELNGVAVMQNFYLVAAPGGEQVVLAFTLSPKSAEKLGARDLSIAASLEVPAGK